MRYFKPSAGKRSASACCLWTAHNTCSYGCPDMHCGSADLWRVAKFNNPQDCLLATCRLLVFATGSDRVPVKGLAQLQPPFTISRAGPHSDPAPTPASTTSCCLTTRSGVWCLWLWSDALLLPGARPAIAASVTLCWPLQDKEYLQQRLLLAIDNST